MRDIIIKGKDVRREAWILLGCLVFAECLNVFAIIKYSRPAVELVSMIGYVVFTAVISYLALLAIRLLSVLTINLVKKLKRSL